MMAAMPSPVRANDPVGIPQRIHVLRGQRVLLDADLAALYVNELRILRSQNATSRWGGRRYLPLAFTEHGAIMAATVLNSPQARGAGKERSRP